jgi:4-amino-4-deoxy-L-arabinose transferase-like glycosyltransferase
VQPGLLFCLLLALAVRLPGIARPLVGNFATKNVVYAMIARNWAEGRADLRYPTLDRLAAGQRSLHMLEFPCSAYLTGWLWKCCGGSLDVWGRATAIGFSLASVSMLYYLVRRRHGPVAAVGAAMALAISPVSIIYGQSFMLESSLVFFTVGTVWCLDHWLAGARWAWLAAGALCLALLLLTKIYMLVMLLPLAAMIVVARQKTGPGVARRPLLTAAALALALIPAAAWYAHAIATARDSTLAPRVFYSVLDSVEVHRPPHRLLRSPDFYRQILDDLAGVVLTPLGLSLAIAGLLHPAWRRYVPWLVAMTLLVAVLPLKFHQMNYYWMAVLPPLAILIGLGWQQLHDRLALRPAATAILLAAVLLFALRYALRPALVTPQADRAVVPAGQAIQKLTSAEEPVATMHGTGIDLLYYCRRPGWAVAPDAPQLDQALHNCRLEGARYLVVVEDAEVMKRIGHCPAIDRLVASDRGYTVYRLTSPR